MELKNKLANKLRQIIKNGLSLFTQSVSSSEIDKRTEPDLKTEPVEQKPEIKPNVSMIEPAAELKKPEPLPAVKPEPVKKIIEEKEKIQIAPNLVPATGPIIELFSYLDTARSENLLPVVKKAKALLPMALTELRKDNRIHIEFKTPIECPDVIFEIKSKPFKLSPPPSPSMMGMNQAPQQLDPNDNIFLWSLLEIKKSNWQISIAQDERRIKSIRISSLS